MTKLVWAHVRGQGRWFDFNSPHTALAAHPDEETGQADKVDNDLL
jgi:hypothetical protein